MYKIPRRDIYCDSIRSWAKEMVWVFIVIKVFASDIDAITCHCGDAARPDAR